MAKQKIEYELAADIRQLQKSFDEMHEDFKKSLGGMEDDAKGSSSRMADVFKGSFLGTFASNIAQSGLQAIAGGVSEIGDAMIGGNAEMEKYSVQFEVLLGSAGKAQQRLDELATFAAETPFELPEIVEANKLLQTFGGEALATGDSLTMVGDMAAAAGVGFNEVAMWVGRAYTNIQAGRPFGEAAARLQELGLMSGESRAKLEGLQKSGASSTEVWEKFTSTMDGFGGMMEKQSQTFEGLRSTVNDVMGEVGRQIGEPVFDAAKQGLIGVLEWLQSPEVKESMDNIADGIEEIASLFDSQGESMQRVARQQRENIQNAISYNEKRIDEFEAIDDLAGEYEKLAGKTKLSADEQERLENVSDELNSTYPGLIDNTDDLSTNLQRLREKTDEAAQATARLKAENESLSKALTQSAINEMRGKVREDFESLIDAVDTYRDRLGTSEAAALRASLGASQFTEAAAGVLKLLGGDRNEAHAFARSLLDNEDALNAFNRQYIELSDKSKGQSPFLPYMAQVIDMVNSIKTGKAEIIDLKNQMNRPVTAVTGGGDEDTGGDDDAIANKAFQAAMVQLKREQEIAITRAKLARQSEQEIFEIRRGFLRRQIDVAQKYAQDTAELQHDMTMLRFEQLIAEQKQLDELLAKTTARRLDIEANQIDIVPPAEKTQQQIDATVGALDGLILVMENGAGTFDAMFANLQQVAGEQSAAFQALAIARATISTYESATAVYAAAAAIPIIGPVLAPIAAGTAVAAGLANVAQIANVKFLAEGGVLDRPTFVAGEAGQEFVAPMEKGAEVIAEKVLARLGFSSSQQRRTKINDRSRSRVDVNIGTSAFSHGGKSARISKTNGML
jgi:hypothetical protein